MVKVFDCRLLDFQYGYHYLTVYCYCGQLVTSTIRGCITLGSTPVMSMIF